MTVGNDDDDAAQKYVIELRAGAHDELDLLRVVYNGQAVAFRVHDELRFYSVHLKHGLAVDFESSRVAEQTLPTAEDFEIKNPAAGTYRYQFSAIDEDGDIVSTGSGGFLVEPQLPIPPSALCCQTYLTKLLGPLSEWGDRLEVAHRCGYNVVHLTPVQQLGISNSSYSIADFATLNWTLGETNFSVLQTTLESMTREWGILFMQDVVWNHVARNSQWLKENPSAGYNCAQWPHLRPGYILDRRLARFSFDISQGKYTDQGLPPCLSSEGNIQAMLSILRHEILSELALNEFFEIDTTSELERHSEDGGSKPDENVIVKIVDDPEFRRFGCKIRLENLHSDQKVCRQWLQEKLAQIRLEIQNHVASITDNILEACAGHVRYERLAGHGPKFGPISEERPLVANYFVDDTPLPENWRDDEKRAYDPETSQFLWACNGWVMGADALLNFAEPPCETYVRRQLVAWGDSIKLDYGKSRDHNPVLWDYMTNYTRTVARLFHGVRIDNCHSTPIHVAEFLLSEARKIRPSLFVVAELFTNHSRSDHAFVARLGITHLIREAQSSHDPHDFGRQIHRFGGAAVGSLPNRFEGAKFMAPAMLFDQTHDNPSSVQIHSEWDALPTAALTSAANCALGSTRGYDELLPEAVSVVTEDRLYLKASELDFSGTNGSVLTARTLLNKLHVKLAEDGFDEIFVDQLSPDTIAVTRHSSREPHRSILIVARTAFSKCSAIDQLDPGHASPLAPIRIEAQKVEGRVWFEMWQRNTGAEYVASNEKLVGLQHVGVEIRENFDISSSRLCSVAENGHVSEISLRLPIGGVLVLELQASSDAKQAILEAESRLEFGIQEPKLSNLSPLAISTILFRCDAEERAASSGNRGCYAVPNLGQLVYGGLEGVAPLLENLCRHNALGDPLCENLRQGCWLAEFLANRLGDYDETKHLVPIVLSWFSPLHRIPAPLRPSFFARLFWALYAAVVANLPPAESRLNRSALGFLARLPGAGMPPVDSTILPYVPASLAAGLPHFAEGIWRNWGRDTFIALPGCLILGGRLEEARAIIAAYAGAMRHGQLPNLLGEGKEAARYNCRDAVWWWLSSIVSFDEVAQKLGKSSIDILTTPILRLYPRDDSDGKSPISEPLWKTVLEAVQRHFDGIDYRERRAGKEIDEHMQHEGFNVRAYVCRETGLIFGGNSLNCGTWMDKMGRQGVPATPRDGAAVELQGLAAKVLNSLDKWHRQGRIPVSGVNAGDEIFWTWRQWLDLLKASFERHFWVSTNDENPLIHRREIVRDTVGASANFADFQLRPNFAIALAESPDILPPEKAWRALETAGQVLVTDKNRSIGIATLDPRDFAYRPNYVNSLDNGDPSTAHGFNYHQGPEWLWVRGYFQLARLEIAERLRVAEKTVARKEAHRLLSLLTKHAYTSPWHSLPELTQGGGAFCADSCPAQAWSVGLALQIIDRLRN